MPFFQGLRLVMSHGPYVKLIAGFLFTSLAFMVSGGLRCSSQEYMYRVGVREDWGCGEAKGQAGWRGQIEASGITESPFFFFHFHAPAGRG